MTFKEQINKVREWFQRISRTEAFIFLLCLFIAGLFWFLKTLGQSYTTSINLPLRTINMPEDKMLRTPLPDHLNVRITAPGWDLLALELGTKVYPFYLDLSQVPDNTNIMVEPNSPILTKKIPESFNILDIDPDTLSVIFDSVAIKYLPVKLASDPQFAPQHGLSGSIEILPPEIKVTGPKEALLNLQWIYTEKVDLSKLKKNREFEIKLQKPLNTEAELNQKKVTVRIPVGKLTEQSLTLPIYVKNEYLDFQLQLIPDQVDITFQTALKNYKRINKSDFRAEVNAEMVDTINLAPLKVTISEKPDFIYGLRYSPQYVDYVINKEGE